MDDRPIGVFDSGLGGLTAVRELRQILPGEKIIYFGDTGRVPYGTRSRETILQYARQDIAFLLEQDVKFVMAACGTVSSTYPLEEAGELPVPYTGVVGAAARAAAAATKNRRIGIIGTSATIRSGSYEHALHETMGENVALFSRACPLFVSLVENGFVADNDPVATPAIAHYLTDLRSQNIDTLILGCTHFPLLKKGIADFMGPDVALIDPGYETALATRGALQVLHLDSGRETGGSADFYVSDSAENFADASRLFLGELAGGPVRQIAIEQYQL